MSDFASLADGGRRLAPVLAEAVGGLPGVVLLAAIPNGVPVALGAAETLALEVSGLAVERSEAGACVPARPDLAGRHVVVVDDGVETGRVARAAAASLRASGVASLRLAVPVCPREAEADLQHRYDEVIAVVRPMARRDLAWHYAAFDTIDDHAARRLLWDHNA
ncbi:MAG: phosphoribosyltransferase family protein [Candidatus Nanopelagicales bacterium]